MRNNLIITFNFWVFLPREVKKQEKSKRFLEDKVFLFRKEKCDLFFLQACHFLLLGLQWIGSKWLFGGIPNGRGRGGISHDGIVKMITNVSKPKNKRCNNAVDWISYFVRSYATINFI